MYTRMYVERFQKLPAARRSRRRRRRLTAAAAAAARMPIPTPHEISFLADFSR